MTAIDSYTPGYSILSDLIGERTYTIYGKPNLTGHSNAKPVIIGIAFTLDIHHEMPTPYFIVIIVTVKIAAEKQNTKEVLCGGIINSTYTNLLHCFVVQ